MEQYLRCFLSYHQDDWADILHFAKFSYNNSIHASTKVTPFYAYTGCHPRWSVLETPELPKNPCADDRLERLRKIQVDLSTHLQQALQTHKVYVDRHRLPSSFIFEIGCGCYDDTSRLLAHGRSWITGD